MFTRAELKGVPADLIDIYEKKNAVRWTKRLFKIVSGRLGGASELDTDKTRHYTVRITYLPISTIYLLT